MHFYSLFCFFFLIFFIINVPTVFALLSILFILLPKMGHETVPNGLVGTGSSVIGSPTA